MKTHYEVHFTYQSDAGAFSDSIICGSDHLQDLIDTLKMYPSHYRDLHIREISTECFRRQIESHNLSTL